MMGHWHDGWNGADWLLMSFGMLLFWTALAIGVVWLVRSAGSRQAGYPDHSVRLDKPAGAPRPTAREVLDERYARGEIDDDEYRMRRDTLGPS